MGKKLAKKRVAYHGKEKGTAETLTMEQVLPALPPEGVSPPGDANESSQSQGVGPKEVWETWWRTSGNLACLIL